MPFERKHPRLQRRDQPRNRERTRVSKIDGGLRSLFHKNIKSCIWTAIETGATSRGVADSNFLFSNGCEGWCEFKTTQTNKIKRTVSWTFQIGWHLRRARYGGWTY